MDTQIRFLQQLEEDLLEAAWRESLGGEAPGGGNRRRRTRPARRRRAPRRWVLVTSGAAAVLVISGSIGWFVMRGTETARLLGFAPAKHVPAAIPSPAPNASRRALAVDQPVSTDAVTSGTDKRVTAPFAGPQQGVEDLSKVIKTAEISLIVGRRAFTDSFDQAQLLATRFGGYVVSASSQKVESGRLVVRVSARRFDDAMVALRQIGRVEGESVEAKDVTADFIDIGARLQILRARREALLALLRDATSLGTILRLERMVDDVSTQIDQLIGRLRYVKNQTSLATIRVDIRESGVVVTPLSPVVKPSLARAWQHSIAGFFGVIAAVTIGLGYVIPTALLALVAWLVVRRVRRRRAVA